MIQIVIVTLLLLIVWAALGRVAKAMGSDNPFAPLGLMYVLVCFGFVGMLILGTFS